MEYQCYVLEQDTRDGPKDLPRKSAVIASPRYPQTITDKAGWSVKSHIGSTLCYFSCLFTFSFFFFFFPKKRPNFVPLFNIHKNLQCLETVDDGV
jgi:hypothetical protein